MNDRPAASVVLVDVDDRQSVHAVPAETQAELLASTLRDQHGPEPAEVGLAFIGIDEMTTLNQTHMGGSGPTDVLAFPIDGLPGGLDVPEGQPVMLGDIVICPEVAAQAPQELPDELAMLVVHGALHLLGHDHAEQNESALMKSLEAEMLERFYRSTVVTGTERDT